MSTDATRAHIDAERLAAWADHGLPADEAGEVELHLSQCERCQEVLAAFVRSEPAPAVVIPFWARRPVRWSAAGLAAAAALFLIVRPDSPPGPVPDSVVAAIRENDASRRPAPASEAPPVLAASPAPSDDRQREQQSSLGARGANSSRADSAEPKRAEANEQSARKVRPAAVPAAPPQVVVGAAAPVVAPPPPAARAQRAAAGTVAMEESVMRDAARGVFEIVATGPAPVGGMTAAGAAGRSGAPSSELRQQSAPARWRITGGVRVEHSLDAGATWIMVPIEPALTTPLVAGVAAGPSVCWLVGPEGVVLLTTDGRTFRRVSLPERVQLVSVTAEGSLRAIVTAADGRKFSTVDGGLSWK